MKMSIMHWNKHGKMFRTFERGKNKNIQLNPTRGGATVLFRHLTWNQINQQHEINCLRNSFACQIILNAILLSSQFFSKLIVYLFVCLFDWFDSLRPINNLSVIKGRVFLGWTSSKLGLMFLLKNAMQWGRWGSNPQPLDLESSTLPLSHCPP